jgi:vacuolar protein 8
LNDDPAAPSGYDFKQIQSLMSLTLSDNVEMQKNAAVGFLRMSKNSHQPVMSVVLEAMTNLLLSSDDEVLRISSLAMGNFAIYGPAVNKSSIIHSGCLRPLIFLLKSQNLDIQCNSCACLTTLASSDANRLDIVHQGAVRSLINLARQSDTKAQVGASGALLNLSHSGKCRMQLVEYGVIPVLIDLLKSPEESVQFYTAAALSNIVVEVHHRRLVMEHQGGIVIERLVYLMRSTNQRVQSQSCLAFRNIASEDRYQVQLVKSGGLAPLLILIKSDSLEVSVAAVAALRNLSIHSSNAGTIVDAGFLPELGTLLDSHHCPDLQYHVAGTLRNLAAEDRVNSILESGCLSHLAGVLRDSSVVTERVLSECTVTLSALASSGGPINSVCFVVVHKHMSMFIVM